MRSKLAPKDSFWTSEEIQERFDEQVAKKKLDAQIEQQRRAIQLAGQILVLRNMPGFSDFCKALQDIRDHAVEQLKTTTAGNDWLRVLQGQCQAYDNILAVMQKGEARVQALERALKQLQNERAVFNRPSEVQK